MNKIFLKKLAATFCAILLSIYVIFLILPFIITPIVNKYLPQVSFEIKKATGLESKIEGFRLVTTPKLTVGVKVGEFELTTADKKLLEAENFQAKMSLIPLLAKRIELDVIQLEEISAELNLNKKGEIIGLNFETTDNKQVEEKNTELTPTEPIVLPFGLKLSNHLPDIKIGEYSIKFIDASNNQKYEIKGEKAEITDFVLNKSVKVNINGKMTLRDREQFVYNARINNRIMPDLDLNELIFNQQPQEQKTVKQEPVNINILDILKGLYDNRITANVDANLFLSNESKKGSANITNLSVSPSGLTLPPSDAVIKLNGNKIDINSNLYTAQNEVSKISGIIKTGKNTNIDLNFKSDAELNNVIKIVNAIANVFNIKDLQTLSAKGKLDIDFNIKSNMKNIVSNGHFKIPTANVFYGLYNIGIEDINADVKLDNNNININNIGFSILNQPLRVYGKISNQAVADVHINATDLSLKGLIVACGQAAILKENNVSGLINLNADITGKLDKIKPVCKIDLNNLNIKNIPLNTSINLPKTNINIIADGQSFSGTALSEGVKIINPAAKVSIPKIAANIHEEAIEITETPVQIEKINLIVSGKIKNYLTEKIGLDFKTTGDVKSTLTGDMNLVKQSLNLKFSAPENSTIIIPMFDKSKLTFNGEFLIHGNMMNPILSGNIKVPTVNIPEIPVVLDNMDIKLNGTILNGNATVQKFTSGGIVAENLTTDFSLKGENFYLNNIKGIAFDGNVGGNIIYNLNNAKTSLDFKGEGLNAQKAIAGAVGLNDAMSGTLNFDTKMTLTVADYNDMMKSLKGNLTFRVDNGAFGKIGRLEHLLGASNIVGNAILKTTVSTLSTVAGVKNSAVFDYITGEMTFDNGWANISSIKSTGKTLAYFIYGKYNLINGTTNVTILGRLHGSVVALLGPIGELSAEKLLNAIPVFGPMTAKYIGLMTTDPSKERTSEIPKLSDGEALSSEFKVVFNGGIESDSSIKSFKWLTTPDTSELESVNVVDTIKNLKDTVNVDLSNTVKTTVDTLNNQKEILKNTAGELKNLFKF